MTLRERAMAPPGENGKWHFSIWHHNHNLILLTDRVAYAIGKGALAGGAALGIGALCFYGLSAGSGDSIREKSQ